MSDCIFIDNDTYIAKNISLSNTKLKIKKTSYICVDYHCKSAIMQKRGVNLIFLNFQIAVINQLIELLNAIDLKSAILKNISSLY